MDDKCLPILLSNDGKLINNQNENYDQVMDIQCGGNFTIVHFKNGSLSFFGTVNGIVYPSITSLNIFVSLKCIQVACGRKHSLLLMERSIVMSYGSGFFGQLGHGDDASWDSPRLISSLEPRRLGCTVQSVACGSSHSGIVTKSGKVFMWGLNRAGQCGQTTKTDSILEPTPVDFIGTSENANQLVCGRNHTGFVSVNGKVFIWGDSTHGKLGLLDCKKFHNIPTQIPYFIDKPVSLLRMGDMHTMALTISGHIYSWGSGMNGRTGHSTVFNLKTPKLIEYFNEISIKSIGCGASWSYAISSTGTLFTWGYGDGGWLGLQPPKYIERVDTDNSTSVAQYLNNLTCLRCFDSRMDVISPQPVIHLLSNRLVVESVSAGAGHMVIITRNSEAVDKSNKHTNNQIDKDLYADSKSLKNNQLLQRSDSSNHKSNVSVITDESSLTSEIISSPHHYTTVMSSSSSKSPSIISTKVSVSSKYDSKQFSPILSGSKSFSPKIHQHSDYNTTQSVAFSPPNPNILFNICRHKKITELKNILASDGGVFDVNIQDSTGNTPLIVACQNGHLSICEILINYGAKVNISNFKGNTALHYSFNYGYEEIGCYLIGCGADEFQTNNEGLTCYEGLTQSDLDLL